MSPVPRIIAFSSGAEKYHRTARRLKKQCEEFGYPHDIEVNLDLSEHLLAKLPKIPFKFWIFRYIPTFIKSKLYEYGKDVLYLHGDFEIKKEIPEEAFEGSFDVGMQRRWKYAVERSRFTMLAAPLLFRANDQALRFLNLWEAHCLNVHEPDKTEHAYLLYLWKYLSERDQSLDIQFFNPHIASLQHDADASILGHKGGE